MYIYTWIRNRLNKFTPDFYTIFVKADKFLCQIWTSDTTEKKRFEKPICSICGTPRRSDGKSSMSEIFGNSLSSSTWCSFCILDWQFWLSSLKTRKYVNEDWSESKQIRARIYSIPIERQVWHMVIFMKDSINHEPVIQSVQETPEYAFWNKNM